MPWYPRSPLGLAILNAGMAAQRNRTPSLQSKNRRRRHLSMISEEAREGEHVVPHSRATEGEPDTKAVGKLGTVTKLTPRGGASHAYGCTDSMQTDRPGDATSNTPNTPRKPPTTIPSPPNTNDAGHRAEDEQDATATSDTYLAPMLQEPSVAPGRKRVRSRSRSPSPECKRPAQQLKYTEEAQINPPTNNQTLPTTTSPNAGTLPPRPLLQQPLQDHTHTPTPNLPSPPSPTNPATFNLGSPALDRCGASPSGSHSEASRTLKQTAPAEEHQTSPLSHTNTPSPTPGQSSATCNPATTGSPAEDRNAARTCMDMGVDRIDNRNGDEDQTSDAEDIVLISRGTTPLGGRSTTTSIAGTRSATPGDGMSTTPSRTPSPTPGKKGCLTSDEGTSSDLGTPTEGNDRRKRERRKKRHRSDDLEQPWLETIPRQPLPTNSLNATHIPMPQWPNDKEEEDDTDATEAAHFQRRRDLEQYERALPKPADRVPSRLQTHRPPFIEDDDDEVSTSAASTSALLTPASTIRQSYLPCVFNSPVLSGASTPSYITEQGAASLYRADKFSTTTNHHHNGRRSSRGIIVEEMEDQAYEGEHEQVVYPEDPSVKARRMLNESLGKDGSANAGPIIGRGDTWQQPDYTSIRHTDPNGHDENDGKANCEVEPFPSLPRSQHVHVAPQIPGACLESVSSPQAGSATLASSPLVITVPPALPTNPRLANNRLHSFPGTPQPGVRLRTHSEPRSDKPAERLKQLSATEIYPYPFAKGYSRDISSEIDPDSLEKHSFARGSFGDIRRASLHDGRRVAIKCLHLYISDGDTVSHKPEQKLLKEIRVWSRLKHKNVLPLLGLCAVNNELGMVSEFMPNGNLQDYVRRNPAVDRYQLAIDVCDGLAYLHEHERRVVHGDLKAANVVVDANGTPKLTDFGLAQMIRADDSTVLSPSSSSAKGTARWMARELLCPVPPNTACCKPNPASDVHSLGMTIYEIFSGLPPFANRKYDPQVIAAIMRGELPERVPNVFTEELWELLLRCWHSDPCKRPTAREVLATLQNLNRMWGVL